MRNIFFNYLALDSLVSLTVKKSTMDPSNDFEGGGGAILDLIICGGTLKSFGSLFGHSRQLYFNLSESL